MASKIPFTLTPAIDAVISKLFKNVLFGPDNHKSALISHYLFSGNEEIKLKALTYLKEILASVGTELTLEETEDVAHRWYRNNDIPFPLPTQATFTFIDLFAGIGGFRIALQELGGKCVFSSEWNKDSQRTYFDNFGEIPFGDITLPETKQFIPQQFDILCAGFPCQPFSLAGVSARNFLGLEHGFNHPTQGNLFFEIVQIALKHKPKVLFLENVKNLKSHDKGNTFRIIEETIKSIGYKFIPDVINSKTVVAQKRERTYMVCFLDDKIDFAFPEFEGEPLKLKSILQHNVPEKYTISDKLWEGHQRRTKVNLERGTGFTAKTADLEKPANTIVARYGKDGKECLIPQEGKNPRMLTPKECARLMGYPENFVLPPSDGIAYKQFGNSVAVPVIKKIAEKIIKEINP